MKKNKKNQNTSQVGIESKIAGIIAKIVVLLCVVMGIVAGVGSYTSAIGAMNTALEESAQVAADLVDATVKEYTGIATELGSISQLADAYNALESKQEILSQRIERYGFEDAFVTDEQGINIFTEESIADTDYFQAAMNGGVGISTPVYNAQTGKVEVFISAPLWDQGILNGKLNGAVVVQPDGEFLNDIMRGLQIGKGGTAFMVDGTGTTIADWNSELVGVENGIEEGKNDWKLRKFGQAVQKMADGKSGLSSYFYEGKRKIMAYAPVPDSNGWSVSAVANKNEFLRNFYIALIITVILAVCFVFIGIKQGARTGKRIAEPIILGVKRLELLATGDLTTPVPEVGSKDEVESLMQSLGVTIGKLRNLIQDISDNLESISQGILEMHGGKEYDGDFRQISLAFRDIVSSLNKTMKEIDLNAEQVSKGSENMANAAKSLAMGATDQASAIEQMTATIESISDKIQTNAAMAVTAQNKVAEMKKSIANSNEQMENTIAAIGKIMTTSNEIANIMNTVEDIAEQTNLLSLNAAIEAARAGEAGKGFAVVADEVRHLAEQSAEAAQNTSELINNAVQAVEEGTRLTKLTAESLEAVVQSAVEVNDVIEGIAVASKEQADAAEQISNSIEQISSVVENNSAAAEESAASSNQLSSQAVQLKDLIEQFRF